MIALMFLAAIVVWLMVSNYLSNRIYSVLSPKWRRAPVRVLLFAVLLILPVTDEIVGRWQFNQLCEREAVIWLSPDWEKVKRAARVQDQRKPVPRIAIPVTRVVYEKIDIETGYTFLRDTRFITDGGFLMGSLGLGLGVGSTCRPPNAIEVSKQIQLSKLLENGAAQ